MLLLRLPNEILIQAANELDPKSFNSFLLTSRFFATLLTPLLHNFAFKDKEKNLSWASKRGHEPLARLILETGTSPNVYSAQGRYPLHEAADYGHEDLVLLLLRYNAEVCAKDEEGATALHYAASSGHPGIARLLLQSGADEYINGGMDYSITPLLWSIKGMEVAYSRVLEKENPKCTWEYYWVMEGHVDAYFDKDQQRHFREGVMVGVFEVVKTLLEWGADVHACNALGESVLHAVGSIECFDAVEIAGLLLDNGAKINALDSEDMTPLHFAAVNGLVGVATLLLSRGADVNAQDAHGDTPRQLGRSASKEMKELLSRAEGDSRSAET